MKKTSFLLAVVFALSACGGGGDGVTDGSADGVTDGSTDGVTDGSTDGVTDGSTDGVTDGSTDGVTDGSTDGVTDGSTDGVTDGSTDGVTDGSTDGVTDGSTDGVADGSTDGVTDGSTDGVTDGGTDGTTDGGTDGGNAGSDDDIAAMVPEFLAVDSLLELDGASLCIVGDEGVVGQVDDYFTRIGGVYEEVSIGSVDMLPEAYEIGRCDGVVGTFGALSVLSEQTTNPAEQVIFRFDDYFDSTPDVTAQYDGCDTGEVRYLMAIPATSFPTGDGATAFRDAVNLELNGAACIGVIESDYSEDADNLAKLRSGEIALLLRSYRRSEDQIGAFKLFDLPQIFGSFDDLLDFQSGTGGVAMKSLATAQELLALEFWNGHFTHVFSSNSISSPDDMDGLKIRTGASLVTGPIEFRMSEIASRQYQLLDAAPIAIAFSELNAALTTGVIDAAELGWPAMLTVNASGSAIDLNIRTYGAAVFTSTRTWSAMNSVHRQAIEDALAVVTGDLNATVLQNDLDAKAALETSGVNVVELTDAQRAVWRDPVRPLWLEYEDVIGTDLLDQATGSE